MADGYNAYTENAEQFAMNRWRLLLYCLSRDERKGDIK